MVSSILKRVRQPSYAAPVPAIDQTSAVATTFSKLNSANGSQSVSCLGTGNSKSVIVRSTIGLFTGSFSLRNAIAFLSSFTSLLHFAGERLPLRTADVAFV